MAVKLLAVALVLIAASVMMLRIKSQRNAAIFADAAWRTVSAFAQWLESAMALDRVATIQR